MELEFCSCKAILIINYSFTLRLFHCAQNAHKMEAVLPSWNLVPFEHLIHNFLIVRMSSPFKPRFFLEPCILWKLLQFTHDHWISVYLLSTTLGENLEWALCLNVWKANQVGNLHTYLYFIKKKCHLHPSKKIHGWAILLSILIILRQCLFTCNCHTV